MTLLELAEKVAFDLCIPKQTAELVIRTTLENIVQEIEKGERVKLSRFGVFRARKLIRKDRAAMFKMAFRSSPWIRRRLETNMEKLGVQFDNTAAQLAKLSGTCPVCKQPLESKDPPKCVSCGTTPFEPKTRNFSVFHEKKEES